MPVKTTRIGATIAALLVAATAAGAQSGNWGAYLAGSHAGRVNDFEVAAEQFVQALVQDPANPVLLERAVAASTALGDVDRAVPVARRLIDATGENQIASLVLLGDLAQREQWDEVLAELDGGERVGPLFDTLMRAWAQLGAGRMTDAQESFDEVIENSGIRAFGLYHKALALATAGDFEGAEAIFSGRDGDALQISGRALLAHVEILSHLDRQEDALALLDERMAGASDPVIRAVRADLEAGETLPLSVAGSAREGVAEIYFSLANVLAGEADGAYTLLYTRLAEHVRPDHTEALLMSAGLLERLERFELATEAYRRVPREHPQYVAAELGRAEALSRAGREDAAIEVLRSLAADFEDLDAVHVALGDLLRREERFAEARDSYDRAIALYDTAREGQWPVYFARGIAHERTDQWEAAEADFRTALELQPDQPQVLNYLGYSYLERGENYAEALDLIERAVEAEPESGYIVDSLGWAFYRLDRFDEAVDPLERAVELMPTDPVINDHLGDAYWQVGRKLEARFQWRRALSFEPEEEEVERIREKLDMGLDESLTDEGSSDDVTAANDG